MRSGNQKYLLSALLLLFCAGVFASSTWYVHYNQRTLESTLRNQIQDKKNELITLADVTDRNGGIEGVEAVVMDCNTRNEYESLLVNLSTLNAVDLLRLRGLSDACGSFYAERKAFTVSKFERELVAYRDYVALLSTLSSKNIADYNLEKWDELGALEKKRSELLTDQKNIQDAIIGARIDGEALSAPTMLERIRKAREIEQSLIVYDKNSDELRSALIE